MPTEMVLVRHGETDCNLQKRHQTAGDGLSELGRRQAAALAARLAGERFDAVYCSDLDRARQTAAPAAQALGREPRLDPRLREIDTGAFQGRLPAECRAAFPDAYARWLKADPDAVCPGGECWRQVQRRGVAFLDDVRRAHPGERVLGVTHGGMLRCLLAHALEVPLEHAPRIATPNTSYNLLTLGEDGQWGLRLWGCTRHLDGVA